MVWSRLENGWVLCGWKGVDGGRKLSAGIGWTDVRLDGSCEVGLGQLRAAQKIERSGEPLCLCR